MPFSITYDAKIACILVSVEGEFNFALFERMAPEVARCINESGCDHILNDMRQANLSEHVGTIYSMPEHAMKAGIERSIKRALVVTGSLSEFWFLETVFLNQGNVVKLFNDIDDARRWLLGEGPDSG
jgi:hypothetical protein